MSRLPMWVKPSDPVQRVNGFQALNIMTLLSVVSQLSLFKCPKLTKISMLISDRYLHVEWKSGHRPTTQKKSIHGWYMIWICLINIAINVRFKTHKWTIRGLYLSHGLYIYVYGWMQNTHRSFLRGEQLKLSVAWGSGKFQIMVYSTWGKFGTTSCQKGPGEGLVLSHSNTRRHSLLLPP